MELQIGQFSIMTRLPVKTLRYYHEIGLLVPTRIDEITGYRYYSPDQARQARTIMQLRSLEFSLPAIAAILERTGSGEPITEVIAEKHTEVRERVAELLALDARLDETSAPRQAHVEVRTVKGDLVISQRFTGAYGDVGAAFGRLGKAAGGLFTGPPYTLYWQEEYLPDGADMETCIPVARVIDSPGITCRVVLAVRAVTSVHAGSFETISAAYERVFEYAVAHDLAPTISVRERYLEGPGDRSAMSPEEYLTEIAVLVTSAENRAP